MVNNREPVVRLNGLLQISGWQEKLPWRPLHPGVDIYPLYGSDTDGPRAVLLRYHPGGRVPSHEHAGYEHIFVLDGEQSDETGSAPAGTLTINPPGTRHAVFSAGGCVVLAIYEKPVKFLEQTKSREPV